MQIQEELYEGVFYVTQITRGTPLERIVGVNRVRMEPHKESTPHCHPCAETVLYIELGEAVIVVDGKAHFVYEKDRLRIPKGACHYVCTRDLTFIFISVQVPAIHDEAIGWHDFEVCLDHDAHTLHFITER